jgi:hypothetical protein
MMRKKSEDIALDFGADEIARRRDEVVRRMANTPPQPNGKPKPLRRSGKKKQTAGRPVSRKASGRREKS